MIVPLDTAAAIAGVKPATIKKWVQRGHINDYPGGYETAEILHWIDQRSIGRAVHAIGVAHRRYQAARDAP
jgi:hypothetical protein